ncbi:hypothetical protein SV1_45 [Streptomyces phage SV1]|nr:hypothetical protein D280_gp45 [Streptomyces phage SV1]AFU62185.1 hypothetical protein SV1_45 [Streptomyces phage SV1]
MTLGLAATLTVAAALLAVGIHLIAWTLRGEPGRAHHTAPTTTEPEQ